MSNNPFESIEQRLDHLEGLILSIKDAPAIKKVNYLSRHETAKLLHVSLPSLAKYTNQGILNCSRIGKRILYSSADIEEAMQSPALKYKRQ